MAALRSFGILPAAGHSTRMGRPKLLAPIAGQPLILHTIAAWQTSRVERIVVVIRSDDEELARVVRQTGVDIVCPVQPPPDMKASVQAALVQIQPAAALAGDGAFLVAPADMPRLAAAIIDRLLTEHERQPLDRQILVPAIGRRRGHPVLFPLSCVDDVFRLGVDEGLDAVVKRRGARIIDCGDLVADEADPFADIDTPEELRKLEGGG